MHARYTQSTCNNIQAMCRIVQRVAGTMVANAHGSGRRRSHQMTGQLALIEVYQPNATPVTLKDGSKVPASGSGTVHFQGDLRVTLDLHGMLPVPNMDTILDSVRAFTRQGGRGILRGDVCLLQKGRRKVEVARANEDDQYVIQTPYGGHAAAVYSRGKGALDVWHRHLSHHGMGNVKTPAELVKGIPAPATVTDADEGTLCRPYVKASMQLRPFGHVDKSTA